MFEKMTERCRRVIGFARSKALKHGEKWVGTDHLLWALLSERGSATAILESLKISAPVALLYLEKQFPDINDLNGPGSLKVPFTPRAKRVIDRAIEFAENGNHGHVGTEHLLAGIALVDDGTGYEALNAALNAARIKTTTLLEAIDSECKPTAKEIKDTIPDQILKDTKEDTKEDGDRYIQIDGKLEKITKIKIKIGDNSMLLDIISEYSDEFINEFEDLLFRYKITKVNSAHG